MGLDVTLILFTVVGDAVGFLESCEVGDSEKEIRADVLNDVEDDALSDDLRVPLTVAQTVGVISDDVIGEFVRVNNDVLVPPPFLCIDADEHTDVLGDRVNRGVEEREDVAVSDGTTDVDTDSDFSVDGVMRAVIEACITDGVLIEDIDDDAD